jgi:hypothetical protein
MEPVKILITNSDAIVLKTAKRWVRQKIDGEKIFGSTVFDVEYTSSPDQGDTEFMLTAA